MEYEVLKIIPYDTKTAIYEAMNIFYGNKALSNIYKKELSDEALVLISLYLGIIKSDNDIRNNLNNMGIYYGDIATVFDITHTLDLNVNVINLDDETYKSIYNKHYKHLIGKIYIIAEYDYKSKNEHDYMMPEKFFIDYIFNYLHIAKMVKNTIIKDTLNKVYGDKDKSYIDSQQLASDMWLEVIDAPMVDDESEKEDTVDSHSVNENGTSKKLKNVLVFNRRD